VDEAAIGRTAYDDLAQVYDWLVPDALLEPTRAAAAFDAVLALIPSGGRVLDCACGTGQLAVGAALRGYTVAATDASPGMIARTRDLAARYEISLSVAVRAWEDLPAPGAEGPFDAVFCVGNSLTHAAGRERRRKALGAMARVLAPDGVLALTSRTWERVRAAGDRLEIEEHLVHRRGRDGIVVRAWTLGEGWDDEHRLDVAVALPQLDGTVRATGERLTFWPFTHAQLDDDLRSAGLEPVSTTVDPQSDRYLVMARHCLTG